MTFLVSETEKTLEIIPIYSGQLGENCIQNFHLGRYVIGYMVGSFIAMGDMISDHIPDYIPPQMNILNMVIPILMHFCVCLLLKSSFVSSYIGDL